MKKTILITGATDGIGFAAAKILAMQGHTILVHGRNLEKCKKVTQTLQTLSKNAIIENYVADLSIISDVMALARSVGEKYKKLDVLINNAGVYKTPHIIAQDNMDVRFVVNTIAPYLLTKQLLGLFDTPSRVINVSSAAQSTVSEPALLGQLREPLSDMDIYAQSKLALTMWSYGMASNLVKSGPSIIVLNPGSLLATKMVKEGFGISGKDISIGAKIIVRTAIEEEFASMTGVYFDNDKGEISSPHSDAQDAYKCERVISIIETVLAKYITNKA